MTGTSTLLEPPPELQQLPQWVAFTSDKVPYNPGTGYPAKANDPSTWSTYEQAVHLWRSRKDFFQGVGIELVETQEYIVLDFDKCIQDGVIDEHIFTLVTSLNSYTEISPSGTGLHTWIRGKIPTNVGPDKDASLRIELYSHDHYMTWTGNHLPGTPLVIEERYDEIEALYTRILEERREREREDYTEQTLGQIEILNGKYGLAALQAECLKVSQAVEGSRNNQLNLSAYALGTLVSGGFLDRSTVEHDLYAAASSTGLGHGEIKRTTRSGIEAGIKKPRVKKPRWQRYTPGAQTSTNGNGNGNGHYTLSGVDTAGKPVVIIGRQLEEMVHDALQALSQSEQDHPTIFVQSARLVKVACDEEGKPGIVAIGVAEIRNELTASANYFRIKGEDFLPVTPPKDIAEAILALIPEKWPFPPIKAVIESPVLRPDGSILDTPGYDMATHLYYMPAPGLVLPAIPEVPTKLDIEEARTFLDGFIADFPYISQADKANTYGLLLTTVVRNMARHVPCALVNGTKAGTGKGLLTDSVSLIATGRTASSISQVTSEEEWDKRITALLMTGATFISIDNVEGILRSAILSKALTSDSHNGRVLGYSKMVDVPQRAIWIANGNNIQLGGDMPRRCYPINMAVQVSDPWTREDFTYPNLIEAIKMHRGKIIVSLLTLARGWFVAGKPSPTRRLAKLGTFSEWVDLVGSILSYVGIEGFLENLQEMHRSTDIEGRAWSLFLETWMKKLGEQEYTVKKLLVELADDADFSETLPDPLATIFADYATKPASVSRKLGKALSKKQGTPYGSENLRIVQGEDTHAKVATYKVTGFSENVRGMRGLREEIHPFACENISSTIEEKNIYSKGGEINPHTPHTPHSEKEGLWKEDEEPTAGRLPVVKIPVFKMGQWVTCPAGIGQVVQASANMVTVDVIGKHVSYHGPALLMVIARKE